MPKLCTIAPPRKFVELKLETTRLNETNDCAVIAVAIACNVPYAIAHAALRAAGRKDRDGTYRWQTENAIRALGFQVKSWSEEQKIAMLKSYPAPHNVKARMITSHHPRRFEKAWASQKNKSLLLFSRGHVLAMKDGVVCDWSINRSLQIKQVWEVEKVEGETK